VVDDSCGTLRDGRLLCPAHAASAEQAARRSAAERQDAWLARVVQLGREAVPILKSTTPALQLAILKREHRKGGGTYEEIEKELGPGWLVSEASRDQDGDTISARLAVDGSGSFFYIDGWARYIGPGKKSVFGKFTPGSERRTAVLGRCTFSGNDTGAQWQLQRQIWGKVESDLLKIVKS
jgi:hypothetical protein